jgi:hypothetical protein
MLPVVCRCVDNLTVDRWSLPYNQPHMPLALFPAGHVMATRYLIADHLNISLTHMPSSPKMQFYYYLIIDFIKEILIGEI